MEKIVPISDLQVRAKKIVEGVKQTRDPVIITQRGRPAALLVNYEDYEGMVATLEEMSQPDWRERLAEAERASKAGKGIELDKYKGGTSLFSQGAELLPGAREYDSRPAALRWQGRLRRRTGCCDRAQSPQRRRSGSGALHLRLHLRPVP